MAVYEFKGLDQSGRQQSGIREADSPRALKALLRRDGIFVTEVQEADEQAVSTKTSWLHRDIHLARLFERITIQDISMVTRQLATLLQAGVPMVDSLTAVIEQVDKRKLKTVLSQIKADVNEGISLADAFAKHPCFTHVYVNMVRAGEASGTLEAVLERLADFAESQAQLRSKITGAMMYPLVMFVVAIGVLLIIMTTVVPRLTRVFEHSNITLPLVTRVLLVASDFLQGYWWLLVGGIAGGVYSVIRWKQTESGRARWDRFWLNTPIFGPIIQMVAVARFSGTLSALLAGGVPLLTTLQIVRNVVASEPMERAVDDVRDAVREGEGIAPMLRKSGQFPPMVTHMIAIGERSGQLEQMLARIAQTYEQQVQARVGILTSLLEPIMIVIMGGIVGIILFAVLLPMMQMSQLVQ